MDVVRDIFLITLEFSQGTTYYTAFFSVQTIMGERLFGTQNDIFSQICIVTNNPLLKHVSTTHYELFMTFESVLSLSISDEAFNV